jgi:DNA-binding Lrp family transcriptional regulator
MFGAPVVRVFLAVRVGADPAAPGPSSMRWTTRSWLPSSGIAPSTCLGRVRALREAGVIRGYHADLDPEAIGLPLQAMIAVRLRAGARDRMRLFTERMRTRPEVRNIYFLAGADDFLLDVATSDAAALRTFVVDELSAHPEVGLTETNLIFEHVRGQAG